ncbi:xanthine dehydrogenase, variant [Capsaspora owczarzaki ATCC 30864]|nr:xanthine dehydrogenase, variant [Capsaspora owczarzaki ATCC 30864]
MLSHYDHSAKRIVHRSANACLAPMCAMDGMAVTTVEGIGSTSTKLHPVQERIAKAHGSQCGFCTPGIVMSMYTLLRNNPNPSPELVEDAFQGNLCRCTGYRPILDAFKTFCTDDSEHAQCHMANGNGDAATLAAAATTSTPHPASVNGDASQPDVSVSAGASSCPMGADCCRNKPASSANDCGTDGKAASVVVSASADGQRKTFHGPSALLVGLDFAPYDPSQELIFPPELMNSTHATNTRALHIQGETYAWYKPMSLPALLEIKHQHPHARLVCGNTEIGIEVKFKHQIYKTLVSVAHLPELNTITHSSAGVRVGASVTLTDLGDYMSHLCETLPRYQTRTFSAIVENLRWFAGHQIRNVSAVAGNIVTASPISDLNPIFMAAGCTLTLASATGGQRNVPFSKFYKGYRQTLLEPTEIMLAITIPYTRDFEFVEAFKQAKRREDDIAIVNAGMRILLEMVPAAQVQAAAPAPSSSSSNSSSSAASNDTTELVPVIREIALSYGGMAPTTVLSPKTSEALVNRVFDESIVQVGCAALAEDFPLGISTPGGMVEYRRSLNTSFFFKFYLMVVESLRERLLTDVDANNGPTDASDGAAVVAGASTVNGAVNGSNVAAPTADPRALSATERTHRPVSSSIQEYQRPVEHANPNDQVGDPVRHMSALKQATGEAIYVDDIPRYGNELYGALVFSQRAHANIRSIDAGAALEMPGVFAFYSAKDIPGSNHIGPAVIDEECFAETEVTCVGQVIGIVLAETQSEAQQAARKVKVEYEDLPAVISILDAIEAKSYYSPINKIQTGDVDAAIAAAEVVVEGEFHMGGQEHFYLETQATLAVPSREDGEMELFVSTQAPMKTQSMVAKVLGVDYNRVNCRVKRMGGGFGGKETRSIYVSCAAAVAAQLSRRPVRIMLDRDEDMCSSGQRHPFHAKYRVGATRAGKLCGVDVKMYSNGGNSLDLSVAVMERALFSIDNVYNIPVVRGEGFVCKTNLPSNTAFRGFGAPQGMMIVEAWMQHLAAALKMDVDAVRELNFYHEGDRTHFTQVLTDCHVEKTWKFARESAHFAERRAACDAFNKVNRWRKRGLAAVPTKFGISFTLKLMNQAGALVQIYTDGSVLLTHGGTEMGQGLHTKMVQVASRELGIPMSMIHVTETSTSTVPNTSPTAASAGSDLNGMAVKNACETLNGRLKPFKEANPTGTFADWVRAAYVDRVSLSSTGFYATPNIGYDFKNNIGKPFAYLSYGASVAEVEIDTLTGDATTLHCTVVMDVGHSLNPAVDIGQVEGGFVQGMGLFTLEESHWSQKGMLWTRGPGMYKIPGFMDIPLDFRVHLLKDSGNEYAIHASKAVGEPPLFLAASVFYAIRDAVASARSSALTALLRSNASAWPASTTLPCLDDFTKPFPVPAFDDPVNKHRWNVVV